MADDRLPVLASKAASGDAMDDHERGRDQHQQGGATARPLGSTGVILSDRVANIRDFDASLAAWLAEVAMNKGEA